jgi:hypothetical protein
VYKYPTSFSLLSINTLPRCPKLKMAQKPDHGWCLLCPRNSKFQNLDGFTPCPSPASVVLGSSQSPHLSKSTKYQNLQTLVSCFCVLEVGAGGCIYTPSLPPTSSSSTHTPLRCSKPKSVHRVHMSAVPVLSKTKMPLYHVFVPARLRP